MKGLLVIILLFTSFVFGCEDDLGITEYPLPSTEREAAIDELLDNAEKHLLRAEYQE